MFCPNISNIEYKPPANNRSGGKVVHVSTVPGSQDWKDRLRFQMSPDETTGLQTAVWGLSTPLQGQDASRRALELSIESDELHAYLSKLDAMNVETATKQSENWFRKQFDESTVQGMYVPLVKSAMKAGFKDTVRVKVKMDGDYPTKIFVVQPVEGGDDSVLRYRPGTGDDLTKNSKCLVIVETVGLWFMSKQFGMSLNATEILVWPHRRVTGIGAFTMRDSVRMVPCADRMDESV